MTFAACVTCGEASYNHGPAGSGCADYSAPTSVAADEGARIAMAHAMVAARARGSRLYEGRWEPEEYRRTTIAQRRAAVARQVVENAAELAAYTTWRSRSWIAGSRNAPRR